MGLLPRCLQRGPSFKSRLLKPMEKYFVLIVYGVLGGLFAERSGLPGGALVGAMIASGLSALSFSGELALPPSVGVGIQILLGISVGMTFDKSIITIANKLLPLAIVSTIILLLVAFCMAFIAHRLGYIDFATALFGFSPGGMGGMSILAQSEGHKVSVVALFHLIRIFTLYLVVPPLARFFLMIANRF